MFKNIPAAPTQVQIEVLGYKTCNMLQMPIVTPIMNSLEVIQVILIVPICHLFLERIH